jgi:hypothetical protein
MKYPEIDRVVQLSLKRLGRDEEWIRYRGGSYETSELIGKYKVEYETQPNGDLQFILWNPDMPCITMYVFKNDWTATLNLVKYSPMCTIDGKMKRGQGTREMLEFAFELAKKKGAERVQLNDESTITCESGQKIKLGPFSFIRSGRTWYEKHFGFKPLPEYEEEYEYARVLRSQLPDLDQLKQAPCEYFTRKVTNELMRRLELSFESIVWEKDL